MAAAAESVVEANRNTAKSLCLAPHAWRPADRPGQAAGKRLAATAAPARAPGLPAASPFTPPGVADLLAGADRGRRRRPRNVSSSHRLGAGTVRLDGRERKVHRRAGGREVRPSPLERTRWKSKPRSVGPSPGSRGGQQPIRRVVSPRGRRAGRSSLQWPALSLPASRPPRAHAGRRAGGSNGSSLLLDRQRRGRGHLNGGALAAASAWWPAGAAAGRGLAGSSFGVLDLLVARRPSSGP